MLRSPKPLWVWRLALAGVLTAVLTYAWATRPQRLRRLVADAARAAGLVVERQGSVRYTPWGVLTISELIVVVPPTAQAAASDEGESAQAAADAPLDRDAGLISPSAARSAAGAGPAARLVVRRLEVRLGLMSLLMGRPRPSLVVAEGASVTLAASTTDAFTLTRANADPRRRSEARPAEWPRLVASGMDVRVLSDPLANGAGGRDASPRLLRRVIVDVNGRHAPNHAGSQGYSLRVDQVGGTGLRAAREAHGEPLAELTWATNTFTARTGWIDFELLDRVLPAEAAEAVEEWRAHGRAALREVVFDAAGLRSVDCEFADWSASPPIEERLPASGDPANPRSWAETPAAMKVRSPGPGSYDPSQRYLQFSGLHARLRYERSGARSGADLAGNLAVQFAGRLNGAALSGSLHADALQETSPGAGAGATRRAWRLDGYALEAQIGAFDFPTRADHPDFVRSTSLPGPIRAFLLDYEPRGPFSASIRVAQDRARAAPAPREPGIAPAEPPPPPRLEGVVALHGATCRYFRFPYEFDDVHGEVRFDENGVHLVDLVGRHGDARVRGAGRLASTAAWTAFDLTFDARGVALDETLYAALPPQQQSLWRDVDPAGTCDLIVRIHRDEGSAATGPRDPTVLIDAALRSADLGLPGAARLTRCQGDVHIRPDRIELPDLRGRLDGAPLRIRGRLDLDGDGRATPDLAFDAQDVSIDRSVPLADAAGNVLGDVHLRASADVSGVIGGERDEPAVAPGRAAAARGARQPTRIASFDATLKSGMLSGFDGDPVWELSGGRVVADADGRRRVHLEGRSSDAALALSVDAIERDGRTAPRSLELSAVGASMDNVLNAIVPSRWSAARELLGLSGPGRLEARLDADDGQQSDATLQVHVEAALARPRGLPLDLRNVALDATATPRGFALERCSAQRVEGGALRLHGRGAWDADGVSADLAFDADPLVLDAELIGALPAGLGELLRRTRAAGVVAVAIDPLILRSAAADLVHDDAVSHGAREARFAWRAAGEVRFRQAAFDVGLAFEGLEGVLRGSCAVDEAGDVELRAALGVDAGHVSGRALERVDARVSYLPADRLVRLDDLHGRLCDGDLRASAVIDADGGDFELEATLSDVDLSRLLGRDGDAAGAGAAAAGRLDGRVFLRGRGTSPTGRLGGGELRIRGGTLLSTPLSASLLSALRLNRRGASPEVQSIDLRFTWVGDELRFSLVDIRTPDQRLVGDGRWNRVSDGVSLTLVALLPDDDLGHVEALRRLIEGAGRELVQYRVSGTAAAPRVAAQPLSGVAEALQRLRKSLSR